MHARFRFVIALCILILIIAIPYFQTRAAEPLDLLWQQVYAQPDDFGVGCAVLDDSADMFLHNASEAFPLASVSKLLIYLKYAQRVDSGLLSPKESVNVNRLELYNLPRTDRGAHNRFMEQYSADVKTIPLGDLAKGMIQYSSNAAADYILDRLSPIDWESLYQTLGINGTGYPHSLTLIPLLMNNHETGLPTMLEVTTLSVAQGERYLDLYIHDPSWRDAEINYRAQRGRTFPSWEIQAAILQDDTVTGTVADFMNILRAIYIQDSQLSKNVKNMTRAALRWDNNTFIDRNYIEYGSKLGFYSGGTLTLVAYGQPYSKAPVLSVAFFRNIPRTAYNEMLKNDSIGEFAHWMNFNQCVGLREAISAGN